MVWVLADYDVVKLCREFVALHLGEVPQNLYFPDNLAYLVGARKDIFDEFDGHDCVGSLLSGLDDLTKRSHTYEFKYLIIFLNVFPKVAYLKVLHCYFTYLT